MTKGRSTTVWVLSALLAALYLFTGGTKLAGMQMAVEEFARYGYPDWFRLVVGAAEVTGAVLLLVPRAALYGAIMLSVVMIGATVTHLTHQEAPNAVVPIVLLVLLAFVAASRRETIHLAAFHWVVDDLHRRIALGEAK